MKQTSIFSKRSLSIILFTCLFFLAGSAMSLDKAYSKTGIFGGIGVGGGAGIMSGGQFLGDLGVGLELGLGINEKLTVALRTDLHTELDGADNFGLFVPGPRVAFYPMNNFYLYGQMGLAIAFSNGSGGVTPGLLVGAGLGFEKFINTNVAGYITMGGDFIMLSEDSVQNLALIGTWLGIRFY